MTPFIESHTLQNGCRGQLDRFSGKLRHLMTLDGLQQYPLRRFGATIFGGASKS
jgi:hypothetical protein